MGRLIDGKLKEATRGLKIMRDYDNGVLLVKDVNNYLYVMGRGYIGQVISEDEGNEVAASIK